MRSFRRLQPPGKGAASAPATRGEHQSARLGETSIPGDGHQSAGCTLVARSPEGQELPKFSDALRRLGNRAPGAAIDGEIIAAAALLGAVLAVGLATATDYPLTVDEFNTDDYGPKALAWYTSGFKDRSHFETVEFSLWYYGSWFHMLVAYVQSFNFADHVAVRHSMTFLAGLASVAALLPMAASRSAVGRA